MYTIVILARKALRMMGVVFSWLKSRRMTKDISIFVSEPILWATEGVIAFCCVLCGMVMCFFLWLFSWDDGSYYISGELFLKIVITAVITSLPLLCLHNYMGWGR